jgi:hypothetical protein
MFNTSSCVKLLPPMWNSIRRWGPWEVISNLIKETPKNILPLFTIQGHSKKTAMHEAGSRSSLTGQKLLPLSSWTSRPPKNCPLVISHPVYRILLEWPKYIQYLKRKTIWRYNFFKSLGKKNPKLTICIERGMWISKN